MVCTYLHNACLVCALSLGICIEQSQEHAQLAFYQRWWLSWNRVALDQKKEVAASHRSQTGQHVLVKYLVVLKNHIEQAQHSY